MRFQGVMAMVLVQDIERALRFYRDTLGFTVQDEQEDWVLLNEGVMLHISPEPLSEVNFNANSVVLTLVVEDVAQSYAELIKKGVAFFLPPTADGGITAAAFRDTEHNLVQLLQLSS